MEPGPDLQDRERFLLELSELSNGDPAQGVRLGQVAQRLGLSDADATLIAETLHVGMPGSSSHGMIEPLEAGYEEIRITEQGLALLEEFSGMGTSESL